MQALGFDRLISVLIPGFVLAASVWMALDGFLSEGALKDGLKRLPEREWQFAFVPLIAAAFLLTPRRRRSTWRPKRNAGNV